VSTSPQLNGLIHLGDEGTRQDHLIQLLELWEFTLSVALRAPVYQLPEFKARTESQKKNLPGAIEELKHTLMGMPGSYRHEYYRQQIDGTAPRTTGEHQTTPRSHVDCPCWTTGSFKWVEGCSYHPWQM
jgi:hypothetical protein